MAAAALVKVLALVEVLHQAAASPTWHSGITIACWHMAIAGIVVVGVVVAAVGMLLVSHSWVTDRLFAQQRPCCKRSSGHSILCKPVRPALGTASWSGRANAANATIGGSF